VPADRSSPPPSGLVALARAQQAAVAASCGERAARWLLVDAAGQRLALVRDGEITRVWSVSTAAAGLDATEDSGGTPPGLHRIARRIGQGAAPGTVFASREPTDRVWSEGEADPDDLIVSRILTLRGLEPGRNQGPGVDSEARYIYIHGTNHPDRIGEPVSHGCVRMTDTDVRDLFTRVDEGDPVVIV
jgi:UDP-N-acetylmuramate--alanine ligase